MTKTVVDALFVCISRLPRNTLSLSAPDLFETDFNKDNPVIPSLISFYVHPTRN